VTVGEVSIGKWFGKGFIRLFFPDGTVEDIDWAEGVLGDLRAGLRVGHALKVETESESL
jgi:hypothetical protein